MPFKNKSQVMLKMIQNGSGAQLLVRGNVRVKMLATQKK
jgi:hypothetical protein